MIERYLKYEPRLGEGVYVAPTALVLGRVTLGERASVWPGAVLRGDLNEIIVGAYTNLQDLCVGHLEDDLPLVIGSYVTAGHGALLHACEVGDGCLIGMGAIVLNGAEIGEECLVAAGALIPEGKKIPPRSVVVGAPGRVVRPVSDKDLAVMREGVLSYLHRWQAYARDLRLQRGP